MRAFVLVLLPALLVGCLDPGGTGGEPTLGRADIVGHWTGDWGDMVLAEGDGEDVIIGAYTHDDGTVSGVLDPETAVFTGWWCEVPSREPDGDAGDVAFDFLDGGATLDGRWRYGQEGDWDEDWDLDHVEGAGPADLVARLSDPTTLCSAP